MPRSFLMHLWRLFIMQFAHCSSEKLRDVAILPRSHRKASQRRSRTHILDVRPLAQFPNAHPANRPSQMQYQIPPHISITIAKPIPFLAAHFLHYADDLPPTPAVCSIFAWSNRPSPDSLPNGPQIVGSPTPLAQSVCPKDSPLILAVWPLRNVGGIAHPDLLPCPPASARPQPPTTPAVLHCQCRRDTNSMESTAASESVPALALHQPFQLPPSDCVASRVFPDPVGANARD